MRILFVTTDLDPTYGYGTYGLGLVQALEAAGDEVRCVVERVTPSVSTPQIPGLTPTLRHMRSILATYHTAQLLRKVTREWQPDLIHFGTETYASSLALFNPSVPCVMTAHGTYAYLPHLLDTPLQKAWSRFATKRTFERLAHIYAVSNYTMAHLLKYAGWIDAQLGTRILVIPNGVSVPAEVPVADEPRTPHTVLFVGGVKARKGPLEAIEAIQVYKIKYGSPLRFRIVGMFKERVPYVQLLRERITTYGLEEWVTLEGEVSADRLEELYAETDVLMMLPVSTELYFEGFGLVYLEANAHGIPVVGSRGSGAEDAIKDQESGVLISTPQASEEAADALNTILTHKELFRAGARRWATAHTWDKIAAMYRESYRLVRQSD